MKKYLLLCTFLSFSSGAAPAAEPKIPASLTSTGYLYEVARHLYRWYMDESDLAAPAGSDTLIFSVRMVERELDEGDRSLFAEIAIDRPAVTVQVKKPDYIIEKLGAHVTGDVFKITNVARGRPEQGQEAVQVAVNMETMQQELFNTRRISRFPDDRLIMKFRMAAREELMSSARHRRIEIPDGLQVIHMAPLSPVANEAWFFWETGRMLLRFSADMDLEDPLVWKLGDLMIDTYDIDEQTVVSLAETPGSGAYMTRDQVGRALYNCIILGRRLTVDPREAAEHSTDQRADDTNTE